MKKERIALKASLLLQNDGQISWLPKNPRQWTQTDIDNTAASIREDEDFLEDRPLLVVPDGKKYVVFAGNLRLSGAKQEKLAVLPCVVYYPETDSDFETVKRRAMKDNGSFGQWDYDELANRWDDLPLTDWGVPAWPHENEAQRQMKNGGLSTEGREGDEGYDEFTEKFKQKLKTDIATIFYLAKNQGVTIERPANAAGTSQRLPREKGQSDKNVPLSFSDDDPEGIPDLREQIIAAQPSEVKTKQGFVYPDNIVTSAVLGRLVAHATELKIRKVSCEHIKSSDSAEEQGRSLYGGGYIMSDRAAAERAAAERAAATRLNISARERAIIERLNEQDKE